MPLMPKMTAKVKTTAMSTRIPMVRKWEGFHPVREQMAWESRGVASEKVVAVAAKSPTTANRSMAFPKTPSTFFPRMGRQASLIRCRGDFFTYIM